MGTTNSALVETAPREVIISRMISAPRELVFDAFTKPEHMTKWFGPKIFTASFENDLRPGGKYRLTMFGPENGPAEMKGPFPMKGEYREIVRPEKLVYTTDLSDHPQSWKDFLKSNIQNGDKNNFLYGVVTITFEDIEGKTKLTITSRFESDAVRDGYVKLQMGEGWSESLDKLESLVLQLPTR
jgi:uncharacterized protein YndB with AHSA1/START domain